MHDQIYMVITTDCMRWLYVHWLWITLLHCRISVFLQGLGRRKKSINQHVSVDLVSWKDQPLKSMSGSQSVTLSTYRPVSSPNVLTTTFSSPQNMLSKYHIFTKGNFHKYPHCHHNTVPFLVRPSTQTTDWSCDHSYVTPLWVMAATQQPLATRNSWKYSYKFR